jgi:predicted dehydrogenase
VKLPSKVGFENAAFTTLGSIAMHGVRQADARVGERVAVIGLGLVGQLVGQILQAAGCRVVGIDLDETLVRHAVEHGAAEAGFRRHELDGSLPATATDCDAVVITAATRSSDPVELAARLARDRARAVVVGDVGMHVPRGPFYDKELDLRLSRSYGPGRYDPEYEERGLDYPIGYVRWTERRNMSAFVDLVESGKVDVANLITDRVDLDDAAEAYERLAESDSSPLAIVLRYPANPAGSAPNGGATPRVAAVRGPYEGGRSVGLMGAGSFAERVLSPGLKSSGFTISAVASSSGLSADHLASRLDSRPLTPTELLEDASIDVVAIATRHSSHANLAIEALRRGKAVFVEKPPALNLEELDALEAAAESGMPVVVGFNRRHAPAAVAMRNHVVRPGLPASLLYRVNAGRLPDDHWINDLHEGGGRLLGEGCHFVDFACWFAGDLPRSVTCLVRREPGQPLAACQSFTVSLEFRGGSLATIVYEAEGAPGLAKERVEAHACGRSAVLDDFRTLTFFEGRRGHRQRGVGRGKGHREQFAALDAAFRGSPSPPNPTHLATMRVTLAALRSAEVGQAVDPATGSPLT